MLDLLDEDDNDESQSYNLYRLPCALHSVVAQNTRILLIRAVSMWYASRANGVKANSTMLLNDVGHSRCSCGDSPTWLARVFADRAKPLPTRSKFTRNFNTVNASANARPLTRLRQPTFVSTPVESRGTFAQSQD